MAKANVAVSALFSTLTTTANTVTNTIGTVNDVVSIGAKFVQRHRILQDQKSVVELHLSQNDLTEDTAKRMTERREELKDWSSKNPTREALFAEAYNEIAALFAPKEA